MKTWTRYVSRSSGKTGVNEGGSNEHLLPPQASTPCYMDTIPNLQVVVEALATVVLLDEKYRPMRVPDFFKHAVAKYQCHQ
jgi:hypothetical protein